MKANLKFPNLLIRIFLIVITFSLFVLLIITLIKYIELINPNVRAAIIAGLVTVFGYFLSRNFERKKTVEQQIREKKIPVYEEFADFIFKIVSSTKSKDSIPAKEFTKLIHDLNKRGIIWFSDNTLKAYSNLQKEIAQPSSQENNINMLFMLEKVLFEFRKDIGHNNKGLQKGDLLASFITDIHKYL